MMKWEDFKEEMKRDDPVSREIIEEAEMEASILSAILQRRSELGLSQRDLAKLCAMPQSSIARIETSKTESKLETCPVNLFLSNHSATEGSS